MSQQSKRSRDDQRQFVKQCRTLLDHHLALSHLDDQLTSLDQIIQLASAGKAALTIERDEQQSKRRAAAGDEKGSEAVRVERLTAAEATFGLEKWMNRMAEEKQTEVVAAVEQLLLADALKVDRLTYKDNDEEEGNDRHCETGVVTVKVDVPDSLLTGGGDKSSRFNLQFFIMLIDSRVEVLDIRIPHPTLHLSPLALTLLSPIYQHHSARRPREVHRWWDFPKATARDWVICSEPTQCDLEVLHLFATLFCLPRLYPPPPIPAAGQRLTVEHWPFAVSAAECLYLVYCIALPRHVWKEMGEVTTAIREEWQERLSQSVLRRHQEDMGPQLSTDVWRDSSFARLPLYD